MKSTLLYRMDWTDSHQGAVLAALGVVLVLGAMASRWLV